MREQQRSSIAGYLAAVAATAGMVVLRWLLDPLVGDHLPLATLYGAVALAVWFGGYRPGLLAAVLGFLACDYLFIQPRGALDFANVQSLVGLFLYAFSCAIIIGFGEAMRLAQRRTEEGISARKEAEAEVSRLNKELRERLGEWQAILDMVPVGIGIAHDPDCRCITHNPYTSELLGVPAWQNASLSAPEGARPGYVVVRNGKPLSPEQLPMQLACTGVEVRDFECDLVREGHPPVRLMCSARPLTDASGRIRGSVGVTLDITARSRAEQALRASEDRFRACQELSLFGFTILNAVRNENGTVVDFEWEYVNPAAAAILKRDAAALVGRRLLDVLPNNQFSSDLFERYVRVVETGESHDYELHYEGEGIDGWFRNLSVKLGDGVAVSFSDVTEHHLQQEQLRASEARFRQLAEAMPQIVWIADASGQNTYLSSHWTRFTGRTADEGLSDRWAESVHPDDLPGLSAKWEACVREGRPYTTEYRLRCKDGEFRWHIVRGVPITDDSGQILCWYGSSTDIDEFKRLAETLREADVHKNNFLATLAHELRNPLAPLHSALEILRRAGDDKRLAEETQGTMERQVAQIVRLVDDLLDISRISQGKLHLRKKRIELSEALKTAVETSQPLIDASSHELTITIPPQPLFVDADPTRLAQVFSNLLNNAAKYTEKGGHIWVTAERRNGEAVMTVRDTGVGIAPEHLQGIFTMFSQVAPALDRSQGGLGIGLPLVRGLVELHGGTIEVHSSGPGKGSEFTVRLPAVDVPAQSPLKSGGNGEQIAAARQCRILVVDDLRDAANGLATILRMTGHETCTAYDGLEAVQTAATFRPDVVLLDIGLPKMNGYEVARAIRSEPWGANVRLVALTGWGQEEDKRRALEAGFDHHLTKPVDTAALEEILAAFAFHDQPGRAHKR